MKITDKWVLKELERMGDTELIDDIEQYPDDERDGRSDIEFFANEVDYFVSLYHEAGHDWCEHLKEARDVLRRTENGKVTPVSPITFEPLPKYSPSRVEWAKEFVKGYRTLERELKKLQGMDW